MTDYLLPNKKVLDAKAKNRHKSSEPRASGENLPLLIKESAGPPSWGEAERHKTIGSQDLENNPILMGPNISVCPVSVDDEEDDDEVTFASSDEESFDEDDTDGGVSAYTNKTVRQVQWKPKSDTTYETMILTTSVMNSKVRGAGFRSNGTARHIKHSCLLSDIRRRCT